jgi:hypothetical protein
MPRKTAVLLLAVLYLLPSHAAASGLGPVDSRLILVFDMRAPGWTLKAKLRQLPTLRLFSEWRLGGSFYCNGDGCPGLRARADGDTRARGEGFVVRATFRRGVVCTFTGSTSDPNATNAFTCLDAQGNVTLQDTFHVGACRCLDRTHGSRSGFCASNPCPF